MLAVDAQVMTLDARVREVYQRTPRPSFRFSFFIVTFQ